MRYADEGEATKSTNPTPWRPLFGEQGFEAFRKPAPAWFHAAEVRLDPANPKLLAAAPSAGPIIVNGGGKIPNLITRESFGDLELETEFLLGKGSNSGIKMHSHYEIQLFDSFGKSKLDGADCGGIYPRAEAKPKYRHLDKGYAPRVNACKAPGEWQKLRIVFRAPRFDAAGKKTAAARFELVELNGKIVHENHEQERPTGHFFNNKEVPAAPLLVQADHGPVAFRGLRVRTPAPRG